jgi:hypothetical protein
MEINELNLYEETTKQDSWPSPDAYQKRAFPDVFSKEGEGDWLRCDFADAFLQVAKVSIGHIIAEPDYDPFYGPAALYLIRHFLELKLKYISFHARWLRKGHWETNAEDHEIQAIPYNHKLRELFAEMRKDVASRMPTRLLDPVDLEFVQSLVNELDKLDRDGERLRYSVKQVKVHMEPLPQFRLRVDWVGLLGVVEHCEQVLDWIDGLLLNQHGFNEDAEMDMAP